MLDIFKTLNRYKVYAESQGLTVYAIALKGSQNYNLHDESSDIDANIVFIPTLAQLRSGEKFKFTFDTGEVTCHNIYQFSEICAKGNPQWIEVCHTPYAIGDLSYFRRYTLNPSALKGMIMEKVTAFSKLYPSRAKLVEEFGYDPKQLSNIIRLYHILLHEVPYYVYPEDERTWMLDIKRGRTPATLAEAESLRDDYLQALGAIYESRKLAYAPQPVDYDYLDSIVLPYYISKVSS